MKRLTLLVPILVSMLMVGCTDDGGNSEPVTIALLAPKTGPLSGVGTSFEAVFGVAIDNINARGGVDGRPLVGITLDTLLAVEGAPPITEIFQQAVDMGAVAIVGPAASGEVTSVYPLAAELGIPVISPSSTAPALSDPTLADDGFLFRNVPDDNIQGIAISHYLGTVRTPAVDNVAVIYENTGYGDGLRGAFVDTFTATATGGTAAIQIPFTQGLADDAAADAAIGTLVTALQGAALPPTMIVMVALEQDAIKLANAWDRSAAAVLLGTQLFLTDGGRSQAFLDGAPASVRGMCGTAPTFPITSLAYGALRDGFESAYPTETIGEQVFAPNVWDATHLLAAALAQQQHDSPSVPLGGAELRDAITSVSRDGQTRPATEWRQLLFAIRSGTNIDYDGAAGPNDFDSVGQAIGPYEVWCVSADGTDFEQELFLEAADLQAL